MTVAKPGNTRTQLYWNTLLKIPVQAIVFVFSILITRILDPADFGIMAIAMILIGYSNTLTNFGFNEAIIQKSIRTDKTINSIFTLNLTVSILLATLFYLSAGNIAAIFDTAESEDVIKIMSSVLIISAFYGLPVALLRRDMNFKAVSIFDACKSLSMSVITLALAMNHMGYWALVYGQLIPLIFISAIICLKVGFIPKIYFNKNYMTGIFHFGGWNFLKTQLHFIGSHIDKLIIGRFYDASSLGYYDKSKTLSLTPYNTLTINVNSVMFSAFSAAKDDRVKLQQQFKKSLAVVAYLNFPMYLGFITIAPYFVHSLLGDKWVPMIATFQIVLGSFIISSFGGLLASMIVGVGKYKELTIRLFYATVFFLAACVLLLRFGIEGIAVAFLLFNLLLTILWMGLALPHIGVRWRDVFSSISSGAVASLIMFLCVMVLAYNVFNEYTLSNMAFLILAGVLTYVLYVLLDRSEIIMELKLQVWADIKQTYNSIVVTRK